MRFLSFLFAFLFLGLQISVAQTTNNSIEIPLQRKGGCFEGTPMGENGFVFVEKTQDQNSFTTHFYSIDLKLIKKVDVPVSQDYELGRIFKDGDIAYFFVNSDKNDFVFIINDTRNHTVQKIEGSVSRKIEIKDVTAKDNIAVLTFSNGDAVLVDLKSGMQTVLTPQLKGIDAKNLYVKEAAIDDNGINLLVQDTKDDSGDETYLQYFDKTGKFKTFLNLTSNVDYRLKSIMSNNVDGKIMIYGLYLNKDKVFGGFYLGEIESGKLNFLTVVKYLDLEDISTDPLKKIKQSKVPPPKKISKYFMLETSIHEVIATEDGYILISEQFVSTYYRMSNGHDSFDGYKFYSAFVFKFDKAGDNLWNSTLTLSPPKDVWVLDKLLSAVVVDGTLKTSYIGKGAVVNQTVNLEDGVVNTEKTKLSEGVTDAKTRGSYTKIEPWYGAYKIHFGQIVEEGDSGDKKGKTRKYIIEKIKQ